MPLVKADASLIRIHRDNLRSASVRDHISINRVELCWRLCDDNEGMCSRCLRPSVAVCLRYNRSLGGPEEERSKTGSGSDQISS